MKNFRLGLFGKKYKDTIINVNKFNSGETNFLKSKSTKLGGIYNIYRSFIDEVDFKVFDSSLHLHKKYVDESIVNSVFSQDHILFYIKSALLPSSIL